MNFEKKRSPKYCDLGWAFSSKCFIPRREIRSISSRGPIEVSFHLLNFGLERVYWTSKTYRVYRVFFARKCFIVTDGRDGKDGDGLDDEQKGPLIFFILRYIKHYTHIYFYSKGKLSGQTSCGFIFWSSWGVAPTIFKITILCRQFSKLSLKVDFLEKNNMDFPLK